MKHKKILTLSILAILILAITAACLPNQITLGQTSFLGPLNISGNHSAAQPALVFESDTDTGFYHSNPDEVSFSANGAQKLILAESSTSILNDLTVSGNNVTLPAGSVAKSAIAAGTVNMGSWISVCANNCDYSTISAAIAGATAGDTILIASGTYAEELTINKDLRLIGSHRDSVVIGSNTDPSPTITVTNKVYISNLSIIGGERSGSEGVVQVNPGTPQLTLDHVTITPGAATNNSGAHGVSITAGTNKIYNSQIIGGDEGTGGAAGWAVNVTGGTVEIHQSQLTGGYARGNNDGMPALLSSSTSSVPSVVVYDSTLRGSDRAVGVNPGSAVQVDNGSVEIYNSTLITPFDDITASTPTVRAFTVSASDYVRIDNSRIIGPNHGVHVIGNRIIELNNDYIHVFHATAPAINAASGATLKISSTYFDMDGTPSQGVIDCNANGPVYAFNTISNASPLIDPACGNNSPTNNFAISAIHDNTSAEAAVTIGVLPKNAIVTDVTYAVITDWNDTLGATVNCGTASDPDAFVATVSINGIGDGTIYRTGDAGLPAASTLIQTSATETVSCQVAETADNASEGSARLTVYYSLP